MARHRTQRTWIGSLALAAVLVTGLWPVGPVAAATATVVITDTLQPETLEVTPGTTVTWRNDSGNRHRIRSTTGPDEFDSGNLEPGQTFARTFSTVGTHGYRDERNPDDPAFHGTIVVTTSPSRTAPPGPGATPAPSTPSAPAEVRMAGRVFRPASLTVNTGTTVRFINDDDRAHTVTATGGGFDSGIMGAGVTWSRTFTVAGTYAYLCALHPDMTGTIAVRTSSGATPPPAAPATPAPAATPRATAAPGGVRVSAVDFAFAPATVDVPAGTVVTWVNDGAALHTITAGSGTFDSGFIAAGATYSRRFPVAGTFPYLCTIHPGMAGTVRVAGTDGATPPPPAPATPTPTARPVVTPAPGSGTIAVLDFDYAPRRLEVGVGSTLRWVNQGLAPHTVTAVDGALDSGFIAPGGSWRHTFDTAGVFAYLCTLHPGMTGTIEIVAGGAVTGPGATDAPAPQGPGTSPSVPAGEATPAPAAGGRPTGPGDGSGPGVVAGADGAGGVADSITRSVLVLALAAAAVGAFALVVRGSFART